MSVIPNPVHHFQNGQELHQFLLNLPGDLIEKMQEKIISISLEIPAVDPLLVLQKFSQPNQLHFYWEKGQSKGRFHSENLAIVALDSVKYLTIDAGERFTKSQYFIQSCLEHIINLGANHLPFAGPHFFCSFTFFHEAEKNNSHASQDIYNQKIYSQEIYNYDLFQHDQYNNFEYENKSFPTATIFLPKLQITQYNQRCILNINTAINSQLDINNLADIVRQKCQQLQQLEKFNKNINYHPLFFINKNRQKLTVNPINSAKKFQNIVNDALKLIDENYLKKIVLAEAIDIYSPRPFNIVESLHNLRLIYPDCYVFSTSNKAGQSFIGASPERLINLHNHQLITDALAGSAPRSKNQEEDQQLAYNLLNSEKDLREHQIVIDFIKNHLYELGIKSIFVPAPGILQLSNIQHLWTPITANIAPQIHILDILAKLHPTPAVAGVPTNIAQAKIRSFESFDRGLYAGPIGWIDHQGNGEFAVGIRSALINNMMGANRKYHARLYAGAGIVAGSQPDKEFAEIQLKLQA
ncbi:MAG: isochorismate synthase, partial [Microcoleaceae cyanobacterium]